MSDQKDAEIADLKAENERLRAELDVLDKSHADLARRLADSRRENGRLRDALKQIGYCPDEDWDDGQFFARDIARRALRPTQTP